RASHTIRIQPQRAGGAPWPGYRDLVELDLEPVVAPGHGARPDREARGITVDGPAAALGHRPPSRSFAVQGHVHRAMIDRRDRTAPPPERVVGREDATDERDDRQAVTTVVAQRIDV